MKKRYSLTLTKEYVEDFQNVAKSLGMPTAVMSSVCDDAIHKITAVLRKAKEQGSFTMADMFTMIAELVEEAEQPKLLK